jgi:hypothetical protein
MAVKLSEGQDLGHILTLSGNSSCAVAQPYFEYMKNIWPDTRSITLQLLLSVFELSRYTPSKPSRLAWTSAFNLDIIVYPGHLDNMGAKKAVITVSGTMDQIVQIAQQIAWFASTFRLPLLNRLGYSTVRLRKKTTSNETLLVIKLLDVVVNNPNPAPEDTSNCWHSLFRNYVLAHGFPVPKRGGELGLEIPYKVMTMLAGIETTIKLHSTTIIIGPIAIIFPTDVSDPMDSRTGSI